MYTVKLTVTDKDNDWGESEFQYVVVYDAAGGFVTGGGWIQSPAGAYGEDPSHTGKANFGFNAKYKKNASVPTGQTEFQLKGDGFSFHSEAYEWLVISTVRAWYEGSGRLDDWSPEGIRRRCP